METMTQSNITYMEAFKKIVKLDKSGLMLLPVIGVHDSLYLVTIKCGDHQYLFVTNENNKNSLTYKGLVLEVDGSPYLVKDNEEYVENTVCKKFDQDSPFSVISHKKLY